MIRGAFGFKQQHKVILLFGAIRPYKGIETALEPFRGSKTTARGTAGHCRRLWERWDRYEDIIRDLGISGYIKKHFQLYTVR
jgi:hypothetical protein